MCEGGGGASSQVKALCRPLHTHTIHTIPICRSGRDGALVGEDGGGGGGERDKKRMDSRMPPVA